MALEYNFKDDIFLTLINFVWKVLTWGYIAEIIFFILCLISFFYFILILQNKKVIIYFIREKFYFLKYFMYNWLREKFFFLYGYMREVKFKVSSWSLQFWIIIIFFSIFVLVFIYYLIYFSNKIMQTGNF